MILIDFAFLLVAKQWPSGSSMMKIAAEGVAHLLLRHTHIHLDASVPQEAHAQSTKVGVRIHVAYDLKLKKNKKKGPKKREKREEKEKNASKNASKGSLRAP